MAEAFDKEAEQCIATGSVFYGEIMNIMRMSVVSVLVLFCAGPNYAMDAVEKNPEQLEMYLSKVRAQFAFAQSAPFYNPELLVVAIEELYSVCGEEGCISHLNEMIERERLQPENYSTAAWLSDERTIALNRGHQGAIAIIDGLIVTKKFDSTSAVEEDCQTKNSEKKNCTVQ